MDHLRSRCLPPVTCALLLGAAMTLAGSDASGQTGASPQDSSGAAPTVAASTVSTDTSGETLRHAVKGRFLIGAAVSARRLDDPRLAALVAEQFDCLTAENEFKPRSLQPQPGKFNFAAADKIVAFAQSHRMKVVGHTLCWHEQSPAWMFRGPDGKARPRDEALRNLKSHIDAVVGHFRGKVIGWDVVNEAISDAKYGYLRNTPARRAIGDDYVAKAFEFAHAADPEAELYYNDYDNENAEKREKTIRLIRELKAKGVRLDAVGIQCHLRLDEPAAADHLDQAIAAYVAEGVKVVISELDVDVLPRRNRGADLAAREQGGADPYRQGLPAEVAEAQARFYRRIFEVVLKHPGAVTRVTFWGLHDGASWLNSWPVPFRTNHPLLWDRALKPKPALRAVLDVLASSVTMPGQSRHSEGAEGAQVSLLIRENRLDGASMTKRGPLFVEAAFVAGLSKKPTQEVPS